MFINRYRLPEKRAYTVQFGSMERAIFAALNYAHPIDTIETEVVASDGALIWVIPYYPKKRNWRIA